MEKDNFINVIKDDKKKKIDDNNDEIK